MPEIGPFEAAAQKLGVDPLDLVVSSAFLSRTFHEIAERHKVPPRRREQCTQSLLGLADLLSRGEDVQNEHVRASIKAVGVASGKGLEVALELLADLTKALRAGPPSLANGVDKLGAAFRGSVPIGSANGVRKGPLSEPEKAGIRRRMLQVFDDPGRLAEVEKSLRQEGFSVKDRTLPSTRAWLTIYPARLLRKECEKEPTAASVIAFKALAREIIFNGTDAGDRGTRAGALGREHKLPAKGVRSALTSFLEKLDVAPHDS
jgi:hypothetical protein